MSPSASTEAGTDVDATWDLDPLVATWGEGREGVVALLDAADETAAELERARGTIASMSARALATHMHRTAQLAELVGRAHSYAGLRFAECMTDEARGALEQMVQERATAVETRLIFFDLEWAELDDAQVEALLAAPELDFCAHHLRAARRYRPHLLTEPEEKILAEKQVTGASAWTRLFDELTSAITVELPEAAAGPDTTTVGLEQGLALLAHPDREVRRGAARAVTAGLAPGLRTRAYVFNTLLADKATDDRLRGHATWLSSRNLANEASDESVDALVTAVVRRYDIPQRWYALKADLLGLDHLADYDRIASVADVDVEVTWDDAKVVVHEAYASFSPDLARIVSRFFDEAWIDAPVRPGKRPGAFCAYTVPSHHPYVLLNWTGRQRDALTLAHELGHGLHAYLAREQGVFHQSTPLTLAETASVFGETVTFGRLLDETSDPHARLALLAESLEGSIATVFRQTAMNRFEAAVHTWRREEGELSVDDFGRLWTETQAEMLGDAVELTDDYGTWWSYIPHFIGSPGYVYAYAFGQLLALSVYGRYVAEGADFVPRYLDLLAAGGSRSPEDLGSLVGVDLADPSFWDGGLDIVEEQLTAAEAAAREVG
ncbi:MAG: M3 family oligoendopeptidase [Acidimicrobiia bacterium]|nr:M3 family oligoendopeptidase [Acidimicrobiia bacterium]